MAERITGHTELVGLFATPIRHSNSPKMHNEAFAKLGIDLAYMAFEVGKDELEGAIRGMRAMGLVGANVSMPNKMAVMAYLDRISEEARLCRAVNTITNKDGILTGYCTDGYGFMRSLTDQGVDVIGKKMTIAGAGGAGTAIEIQAALDGVSEISIFNIHDRFWENAEETVKLINSNTSCRAALFDLDDTASLARETADSVLLVNATSVGMKPMEGQTWLRDPSILRPDLVVTDVIYSPAQTRFLEMAEAAGCKTFNGLGMMLFQGARAFELWTGQQMPIDHVKQVLGL